MGRAIPLQHVSMQRMSCRNDHLFAKLSVRPKPASIFYLSSDRVASLISKGDRTRVVALRIVLPNSTLNDIKSAIAEKYMPTYHGILRRIVKGSLIHADETKGVVIGRGHYVWVFTNLTTVAYVYAKSRESTILEDVLNGFSGVLVSDFYAAYDSVPCAQQKCLIHLMRDINEDLHKNPFDEDLKEIARRFGALLREIVETIDTYGLKARNLGKHKRAAEGFVEHVVAMKCEAEAGLALQKRIEKNRDKLFTFLDYDGVPWNNNNAEHAVRAFTRLRNAIGTSTPKGPANRHVAEHSADVTVSWDGLPGIHAIGSNGD